MKNKQLLKNRLYVLLCVLCCALLLSAGCNKKEPAATAQSAQGAVQPQKQPEKPVQKIVSAAQKIGAVSAPVGSQFDFSNKKDPFKPDVIVKVATPVAGESKRLSVSSLPIHSFDVSQFRLIGIITGSKENQAMVVDPNGKGYVIKSGMTIGKNEGRITTINAGGVEVLEQFKDDNGKLRKENIRLTLPKKQ